MKQRPFWRRELANVPEFVGIAEVIGQIRDELEEAREKSQGRALGFTVENVSLTFTIQVHRSGTGRGGLHIGVVTAELGGAIDHQTTHQIQVDLKPEVDGGRVRVRRGGGARPSATGHGTAPTPNE